MADDKVRITFTENRVVDDHRRNTPAQESYEKDKTYAMDARSADRWVKRQVARWSSEEDERKAAGARSDVSTMMLDTSKSDADPKKGQTMKQAVNEARAEDNKAPEKADTTKK